MSDLSENPAEVPDPLLKPINPWLMAAVLGGMVAFLVIPAGLLLGVALCSFQTATQRSLGIVLAATLLALPVRTVWMFLRRKVKTGQWMPSIEERLELRRKTAIAKKRDLTLLYAGTAALWCGVAGIWIWKVFHFPSHDRIGQGTAIGFTILALTQIGTLWNVSRSKKQRPELP